MAGAVLGLLLPGLAAEAETLKQAEVTIVRNNVQIGEVRDGRAEQRPAQIADVLAGNDFLTTGEASRAQLRFNDNSLVRVGQHALFTFEPETRDYILERGSALFLVPMGSEGTQIRTSAVTCGITGTIILAQSFPGFTAFYVYHGTAVIDGREIEAGQAYIVENGRVRVIRFDMNRAIQTSMLFAQFPPLTTFEGLPDLDQFEMLEAGVVNARVNRFLSQPPVQDPPPSPPPSRRPPQPAGPPPPPSPPPPPPPNGNNGNGGNGYTPPINGCF